MVDRFLDTIRKATMSFFPHTTSRTHFPRTQECLIKGAKSTIFGKRLSGTISERLGESYLNIIYTRTTIVAGDPLYY
jgi:hypothetical protein